MTVVRTVDRVRNYFMTNHLEIPVLFCVGLYALLDLENAKLNELNPHLVPAI